jgi:hypothetical protein
VKEYVGLKLTDILVAVILPAVRAPPEGARLGKELNVMVPAAIDEGDGVTTPETPGTIVPKRV